MSVQSAATPYQMVTASLTTNGIEFEDTTHFDEALKVVFFRIRTPSDIDLEVGRQFAKTFSEDDRYIQVGQINDVNGYLLSDSNQTVRFTLDRDKWTAPHPIDKQPLYPKPMMELGQKLAEVGMKVFKSILRKVELPEDQWFKATAGSACDEGSYFLLTNCYDPKKGDKPFGVGAHKDWSWITVLDAFQPGLEAKIDGVWRSIVCENGYLTINFGYPLEKLIPGITASEHRVITQTEDMRTSTVLFVDPRVGPYRSQPDEEGIIYDWCSEKKELINGIPTTLFFKSLSDQLYGTHQTAD